MPPTFFLPKTTHILIDFIWRAHVRLVKKKGSCRSKKKELGLHKTRPGRGGRAGRGWRIDARRGEGVGGSHLHNYTLICPLFAAAHLHASHPALERKFGKNYSTPLAVPQDFHSLFPAAIFDSSPGESISSRIRIESMHF